MWLLKATIVASESHMCPAATEGGSIRPLLGEKVDAAVRHGRGFAFGPRQALLVHQDEPEVGEDDEVAKQRGGVTQCLTGDEQVRELGLNPVHACCAGIAQEGAELYRRVALGQASVMIRRSGWLPTPRRMETCDTGRARPSLMQPRPASMPADFTLNRPLDFSMLPPGETANAHQLLRESDAGALWLLRAPSDRRVPHLACGNERSERLIAGVAPKNRRESPGHRR